MKNMFDKYPQTFDYFFSIIEEGSNDVKKLSRIQRSEAITLFLNEIEEDDLPVWEASLPTVRIMSQFLNEPMTHINHLQNDFINSVWEHYSLKLKEIFSEAFSLSKCPLSHEPTRSVKKTHTYRSQEDFDFGETRFNPNFLACGV
jgi:hypothetical protein